QPRSPEGWAFLDHNMGRVGHIVDVLEAGGPHTNGNPRKTVLIPHCLRADGGTLCQCDRTRWLVADDVCPRWCMAGHNQESPLPAADRACLERAGRRSPERWHGRNGWIL